MKRIEFQNQSKKQSNDIVVFSKLFVQIISTEMSKFSILVVPKGEFKQMKIFETELVFPDPSTDTYVYFEVDQVNFPSIKSLLLEYDVFRPQMKNIELLFNANKEVSLSAKNPFLPMPVKKRSSSAKLFYLHNEVDLRVEKGSYIVKIPLSENAKPIKIRISMNDRRMIPVNGDYIFNQPKPEKAVDFAAYLPEKGEFRVLLESCQNLEIGNIMFQTNQAINSHQILVQNYSYFYRNLDEAEKQMEVQTLSVPLIRYVNLNPGVVTFQVLNKQASGKEHFNLITEFKKVQENIVWKDFMDYYPMTPEHFEVKFLKTETGETQLMVKSTLPKFKNQLFTERENLKYVSVLYNIYLIPDKNFQKSFKECGFGAIDENASIFKSTPSRVFKNDLDNKVVEIIFD